MKTRLFLVLTVALFAFAGSTEARWGWGGGGYCGPRFGVGYGFGGYYGGGWGGWGGPGIGLSLPIAYYRPAYYVAPAPAYYVRTVRSSGVSATLVRAQAQLANLGYYRGTVDGAFGPLTSRALAQYQSDYRLPVTGRLDRATLKSLGV